VSTQGASKVAGGIALAAVLSVVAIVAWSILNHSDPAPSATLGDGPAMGDITGYVGRVDRNARTVDVAESMFGLRPVTMALTNDTSITVAGKQGGIGDLSKDMQVRAFYEVRNDVKYVTSIQVISDEAPSKVASSPASDARSPVETKPAMESKPAVEARPPVEPKPRVEPRAPAEVKPPTTRPVSPPPAVAASPPAARPPAPVMSVTPRPSLPASDVRPVPPRVTDPAPASLETAATRPAPTPPRPAAPAAETVTPRPAAPAVETARPPAAAAAPPRAVEAESTDGSAAIDWLLKESRRR
jgi:hypothetical protein